MSSVADQLNSVAKIDTAESLDLNSVEVGTKFNIHSVGELIKDNKLDILVTHENFEPKRLFFKNIYFKVFEQLKNDITNGKKFCITYNGLREIGDGYSRQLFNFEQCTSKLT